MTIKILWICLEKIDVREQGKNEMEEDTNTKDHTK